MTLIKTYEEDGYIIEEYDNGTVVKTLKSVIIEEDNIEEEISKQEASNLEILAKLEYLTCLQEEKSGLI